MFLRKLRIGSSGTDVAELQAVLKKIGYYNGAVDGCFGSLTEKAVEKVQYEYGVNVEKTVSDDIWNLLSKYIYGYDLYCVEKDVDLLEISKIYNIHPALLSAANPGICLDSINKGSTITIPLPFEVVSTNIPYTYEIMERNIKGLKARYPFLECDIAGKSVMGKNLYYLKLGNGPKQYFFNASHHSLEWITSVLLMKFVENFLRAYTLRENIGDFVIRKIWENSTIYIMPMVNPDGVNLVLDGLEEENPYYDRLLIYNNGSTDFSKNWQANIRGVDLNHNYDASWNLSKIAEPDYGILGPGPTRYSGLYPESEPETRAVADFTRNHSFRLVIAFHSQGEVIYWNYQDMASPMDKIIAKKFSEVSGYQLDETEGIASFSGYKDWFIEKYNRPGFTVEVGSGVNPLPLSQFNAIYKDNEKLLLTAAVL